MMRRAAGPERAADPRIAADTERAIANELVRGSGAKPEAVMRSLAACQHGLVTRGQLLRAGVPGHVIVYRVKTRHLEPVYRGVYRLGPVRARLEREMAAVLACGEAAALSHASAAVLAGVSSRPPGAEPVDVSVRHGDRIVAPGVRVHRAASLREDEITCLEGIPVTVPARTLLDLAGSVAVRELEQAVVQADRLGLASRVQIEALLARHPRHPGVGVLRRLLARDGELAFIRSEAESRFLTLVRKARLAPPETNVVIRGHEVDFLWRTARLVVEIDGFAFHSSAAAFERDRRRDADLMAAGFRVLRISWRHLSREPEVVLARVAQALVHGA